MLGVTQRAERTDFTAAPINRVKVTILEIEESMSSGYMGVVCGEEMIGEKRMSGPFYTHPRLGDNG